MHGDGDPMAPLGAGTPDTVAAVLLLRRDGAALMQHRDDKPGLRRAGLWVPPGGHCEPGEPIPACARREFLEETGYRLTELHWLDTVIDDPQDGGPAYPLTVFWSCYDERQPVRCLEGQALEFMPRRRAAEHAVPPNIVALWDRALAQKDRPCGAWRTITL
jgi:8-oxo-dGTP pyrophosphatase MutT (NUDIX family)